MGNGQLQRIPEWINIYTIPRYHHQKNTRHHPNEDIEPPTDHNEQSQLRNQGHTKIRFAKLPEERAEHGETGTYQPKQDFQQERHVDTIDTHTKPGKTIISIMDDSRTFATSAVIPDSRPDLAVSAICNYWCKPYGFPETISFKQGKVQTSRLGKRINDLAPIGHKISCWSRQNTFNTEIEQQWQQNQNEISEEEFVHTLNFLCDLQKPSKTKPFDDTHTTFDRSYESLTDVADSTDDSEEPEDEFEDLLQLDNGQPIYLSKRKNVCLCWHKLQGRTGCRSRIWRQPRITEFEEEDTEDEWAQLRRMEKFLEQHKMELLKQGVPELDDENWDRPHWLEENENFRVKEEDDSLENEDLTYITSILDSFSKPRSNSDELNESGCAIITP